MKTKHLIFVLLIACAAGLAAAADSKKPVSQWTCADFIALDDQFQPKAVYWASAYVKGGEPEESMLDIDGTEQITPILVEDCEKEPKASFWEKLKLAWHKVESGAKAEAEKIEKKL